MIKKKISQDAIVYHEFVLYKRITYFFVELLFSSLDVLHLYSFLTHDGTESWLVIIITTPQLCEKTNITYAALIERLTESVQV